MVFIDLMRAYAILMMVQGHTIDTFIAPQYRVDSNWLYYIWDHMRGVTAPVFFFSAGAIFTFLLLKPGTDREWRQTRIKKGLRRFVYLLLIGYLLRFNLGLLSNPLHPDFVMYRASFASDALHAIAFGLLSIITCHYISRLTRINHAIILGIAATLMFYLYPTFHLSHWVSSLPIPIASYFTNIYGSNFPLIPWLGFVLWGAFFGYLLTKKKDLSFGYSFAGTIAALGLLLHFGSGGMLLLIYDITGLENVNYLLHNNFQFFHLGNILIVAGVFSFLERVFPRIPAIIPTIGRRTMMIYILHIFLIYGTGINPGLKALWGGSLNPVQCISLALFFIILFVILSYYWERILKSLRLVLFWERM